MQTASGRPFNITGAVRLATISETLHIMFIRLKPNKDNSFFKFHMAKLVKYTGLFLEINC